ATRKLDPAFGRVAVARMLGPRRARRMARHGPAALHRARGPRGPDRVLELRLLPAGLRRPTHAVLAGRALEPRQHLPRDRERRPASRSPRGRARDTVLRASGVPDPR